MHGATCTEQLAQSNLPTCTDQFAQSALPSNLRTFPSANELTDHEPPSNVSRLLHECFVQEKENAFLQCFANLACDVMLSGQPWPSFFEVEWKVVAGKGEAAKGLRQVNAQ